MKIASLLVALALGAPPHPNLFSNPDKLCKALVKEGFKLGALTGRVWVVTLIGGEHLFYPCEH
jgi:hypothetical protein